MSSYLESDRFVARGARIATRAMLAGLFVMTAMIGMIIGMTVTGGVAQAAKGGDQCTSGPLGIGNKASPKDMEIVGNCTVGAGPHYFKSLNVLNKGVLSFDDAVSDLWIYALIIENGGTVTAGVAGDGSIAPIGTKGGKVTIHLWGDEKPGMNVQAVKCATPSDSTSSAGRCGIPDTLFTSNMMSDTPPTSCVKASKVGGTLPNDDCFYMYDPMPYEGGGNVKGWFGYKTIGLSYGGTLRLYGRKGAIYPTDSDQQNLNPTCDNDPSCTGKSWVRLNSCVADKNGPIDGGQCVSGVLQPGATKLILSSPVTGWAADDDIVLTSSDFLPAHSERLAIMDVTPDGLTVTLKAGTRFPHHASIFDLTKRIPQPELPTDPQKFTDLTSVDTRAAVALLSRSIRVVAAGDTPSKELGAKDFFGGHVVFRQGFKQLQIQGVEFYQLGEGGRIGHYPLHFHMVRQVPPDTFVKDSSVWDSMTRWIVLHATQGVLLARNVGYLSIGHGYYLEDGTETNNKLYANIGITARAAVGIRGPNSTIEPDASNPRMIPGILASLQDDEGKPYPPDSEHMPYDTDYEHPAVFWFMNGWNDFRYNMAVGAETCGMCYWLPPGANSGGSQGMYWTSYASEQKNFGNHGITPLQEFLGNSCSTAMTAFTVNGDTSYCTGVNSSQPATTLQYKAIPNHLLKDQKPINPRENEKFFPRVNNGGNRKATLCPGGPDADCSGVGICADGLPNSGGSKNCVPIILDRFTTSFNFPETNFAAVWLRPQWNLFLNSVITDVLNGGITFVTGGGYTRSDALRGVWDLARKSVFIGSTQTYAANPYAANGGPVNPGLPTPRPTPDALAPLKCGNPNTAGNYCIPVDANGKDLGINLLRGNFGVNQRFYNIYDGPNLEDSNAYLDITTTKLDDCNSANIYKRCENSKWMQGQMQGVPGVFHGEGTVPTDCYLPNAAIAWKQSNAFYYPPAFHSVNLFFNNVDIRHYVIEPIFEPGTYRTDDAKVQARYCNADPQVFVNYSDIDRQTELDDDDGSLTGLIKTISVNQDPFFNAPTEDTQCRSDTAANTAGTAKTSPYDYVTAVVYPDCATFDRTIPDLPRPPKPNPLSCNATDSVWNYDGGRPAYGVPLYRQLINQGETKAPFIKMAGQATGQRSTLIPNNGIYYIDTTVDEASQRHALATSLNVFQPNLGGSNPIRKYHVFLLFAKPDPPTKETFQLFIGKGLSDDFISQNVVAEKGNAAAGQMSFTPIAWPSGWGAGKPGYDKTTGILTVTIDLGATGGSQFPTDYASSIPGRCQPTSMCAWNATASKCLCNIPDEPSNPLFYLRSDCLADNSAICQWAVKDIDYPDDPADTVNKVKGAAYGFSFTMPGPCTDGNDQGCFSTQTTQAARDALRPKPSCFPQDVASGWNVKFNPTGGTIAGDCTYNSTPPDPKFCTNP